jgi:signal transduction histidine kinase
MILWDDRLMVIVTLANGLAYFSLGFAVALESRRATSLSLGKQLKWLALFGFVQSLEVWTNLAIPYYERASWADALFVFQATLLPLSTLLLIRFGVGVLSDAGPIPQAITLVPLAFIVPGSLLISYVIILMFSGTAWQFATDVWSRYLFFFPGCLLAGLGFLRHRAVGRTGDKHSSGSNLLLGAAGAFFLDAVFSGLIVPSSPLGPIPWLNYEAVLRYTDVPIQVWRSISASAVAIFVVRAMGVFEAERSRVVEALRIELFEGEIRARKSAEEWTEALVTQNRKIADLAPIDDVLACIVDSVVQLRMFDSAAIGLWDEDRSRLLVKANSPSSRSEPVESISIDDGFIYEAALGARSALIPEATAYEADLMTAVVNAGGVVPLLLEDRSLGALWGVRREAKPCTAHDLKSLTHLADQAVIALGHAMMASQLQSVAVSKERLRIAREMHDGLAQLLGFLNIELQTLEALARQNRQADLIEELVQARTRVLGAQADIRESILSLRTTLAGDAGLVQSLQEYIDEFRLTTGIDVQFEPCSEQSEALTPMAEVELVRIIQEALANIRKHSGATRAKITMGHRNGDLQILISDNGTGFEGPSGRGHYGLQTMRERADEIGGALQVHSNVGEGTSIELTVPTLASARS